MLGRLASRDLVRALSRTAVAVAALMVALATSVGVSLMVGSFRTTVQRWLDTTLQADIYVSPAALAANRAEVTLDPSLIDRLRALPGVARVSTNRGVVVPSAAGPVRLVALGIARESYATFTFRHGTPDSVWPSWEQGAAIVSEPYASRHSVGVGSIVRLRSDRGELELPVAGVYYDYASDQGVVLVSRGTYERFWDDRGVSAVALYVAPGVAVDDVLARVRQTAASGDVLVRSNRALRDASLEVFDRTFAITTVLRWLAVLVAVVGLLSALMALQLERARELAVLRAQGLTPSELWVLVTSQTGLMGLVAGLLALPVGVLLSVVLVFVINRRSFGWTLELEVPPAVLAEGLALAVVAAVLAGIFPAARMAGTPPAHALREE
jgi:putative ABC transport system permease protein